MFIHPDVTFKLTWILLQSNLELGISSSSEIHQTYVFPRSKLKFLLLQLRQNCFVSISARSYTTLRNDQRNSHLCLRKILLPHVLLIPKNLLKQSKRSICHELFSKKMQTASNLIKCKTFPYFYGKNTFKIELKFSLFQCSDKKATCSTSFKIIGFYFYLF